MRSYRPCPTDLVPRQFPGSTTRAVRPIAANGTTFLKATFNYVCPSVKELAQQRVSSIQQFYPCSTLFFTNYSSNSSIRNFFQSTSSPAVAVSVNYHHQSTSSNAILAMVEQCAENLLALGKLPDWEAFRAICSSISSAYGKLF